MVLPLIPLAIAGAGALGVGTYFGLKNQAPDVTNTYAYSTQNIRQTKVNEFVLGSGASIGTLNIKDSMSLDAVNSATAKTEQPQNNLNKILFYGALGLGAYIVYDKVLK